MTPVTMPSDTLHPEAIQWAEKRGISDTTMQALGWASQERSGELSILFPYFTPEGTVVNIKSRGIPKKGKFIQVRGAPAYLYNLPALVGTDVCAIVEGEADVAACLEAGFRAVVSPQNGAPAEKRDPDTNDLIGVADVGSKGDGFNEATAEALFKKMRRIIIATDNDPGGKKLAEWLIDKYGPVRCCTVQWPAGCKDANDVLVKHGKEKLRELLDKAKPVDLPGLVYINDLADQLRHAHKHGIPRGISTGFDNLDQHLTPTNGLTIVVTGRPSHGKSSFLLNLHTQMAHIHDRKVCMFSPEIGSPFTMAQKIMRIATAKPFLPGEPGQMTDAELDAAIEWAHSRFLRVDSTITDGHGFATLKFRDVMDRFEAALNRDDFTDFVIDPWNRLQNSRPQGLNITEFVAEALNYIGGFNRRNNVNTWIVAHPTKGDLANIKNEDEMPHPYSIADSSHWYNMADIILGVQRNKFSEPKNRTTVATLKVREEGTYGQLGESHFAFDNRSLRFHQWFETEGQSIPGQVGHNPYPDLPGHLILPETVVQGTVTYHDEMAPWDDSPF